jgi:peptide/nickel transport system substrate-binding protein
MLKRSAVLPLLLSLTLLAGCAPPPKNGSSTPASGTSDGGKAIIKVEKKSRSPFETVEKDGIEFRLSRGASGKPGGTFYEASIGDGPKTFNPWASFDATSSTMGGMMEASLLDTDAYTGEPIPYLAKSVSISPDKLSYRVTLRKGLVWSDGKPLTSKDVVFTWNEIIGKGLGNPSSKENLLVEGQFPTIQAIDPLTVEFKTPKPFAPFLRQMGGVNIAPEHVFAPIIKKGGDKAFSAAWGTTEAAQHPERFVSSGMWLLEKYELNERVIFKRNPHFFMQDKAGQRLPYLDRYVVSFVKDLNNMQLQFEQGKLDTYGVTARFVDHVRTLKKPDFNLYNVGPATGTTFLTFNLSTEKDPETGKPKVDPVRSKWFNNVKFRQAVSYAISRQDMVNNILKGVGAPLFTAEALSSIFLNEKLATGHPQDIDKAKALLKESGFTWDSKGQLLDSEGHPVEFTLYTNTGNDQREATGVNIKQDLAQLGIKVNFKPMEFNVLVDKMNHSGQWEAIIMGLTGGPLEPHSGANVWKSSGPVHIFNQRSKNVAGTVPKDRLPWEAEIDSLFDKGAQEFEFAKRKAIYDRFQEVVFEQQPFIYLYSPLQIVAVKNRVQNFDPTPLATFHNLEEIWIKE